MADEKPKKSLLQFVAAGRKHGADLVRKRNPLEMGDAPAREELERTVAEAEAKVEGPLWERDFAATALRSVERSLKGPFDELRARIARARARIEAADDLELGPTRAALAAGTFGPQDFRAALAARPHYQWNAFTVRLLGVDRIPDRETVRPAMMVHYLPSPVDAILAIADELKPDDVFYDIGSGLGLVTMLTAWLSGAKAKGVEYEPAYHRRAVELAEQLGFRGVEYHRADARALTYEDGTVFYLYDTFRGSILAEMLAILERQAARSIRIISRGESTPVLETVPWLRKIGSLKSELTLFEALPQ